jgi:hypothetical protein
MLLNVPQVQLIDDNDHQSVVKITGVFSTATSSNTVVVQANTLYGANSSRPCILAVNSWEYSASFANGAIVLEWVSTANQNTTIMTAGRANDGAIARYIPNNANTPTGDVNLAILGAAPGDTFSLTVSFMKCLQGQQPTLPASNSNNYLGTIINTNIGSGAWANTQVGY